MNTYTASEQRLPATAMDDNGNFVIAWRSFDQDGSTIGVYAQRYDANGQTRGGEFRVNSTTIGQQASPSVDMDADGDFVITWQSYLQDGSHYGVYAQRYAASGTPLGGEFRVNTTTANSQNSPPTSPWTRMATLWWRGIVAVRTAAATESMRAGTLPMARPPRANYAREYRYR